MTQSMMETLRQRRIAAAAAKTIDLAIPGYNGELVARYRLVDPLVEGEQVAENIQRQHSDASIQEQLFFRFADLLVKANEDQGMFFREPDGKLVLIDPDGLGPMGYDTRLRQFLDITRGEESARGTLIAVFNGNKTAIMAHHTTFMRWMEDPAGNAHLGES